MHPDELDPRGNVPLWHNGHLHFWIGNLGIPRPALLWTEGVQKTSTGFRAGEMHIWSSDPSHKCMPDQVKQRHAHCMAAGQVSETIIPLLPT